MLTGSYESYDRAHTSYDLTRQAIASGQIIGMIRQQFGASAPRILDAGCGTGLHLQSLARSGFRNLIGLDKSTTGLDIAKNKLQFLPARNAMLRLSVDLVQGDIRSMPFSQGSFDVILISFVLHHLPHNTISELVDETTRVLSHVHHLLAPDGLLLIVTCSPLQMSADHGCMWYYKYFPQAAKVLQRRFIILEMLKEILSTCGFKPQIFPVAKTYWTEASLDPSGPADPAWQNGDSIFALCRQNPELFAEQLQKLQNDVATGEALKQIFAVRNRVEILKQAILAVGRKV